MIITTAIGGIVIIATIIMINIFVLPFLYTVVDLPIQHGDFL